MALIFTSPAHLADPAAAGTHALVIGVGDYPFLTGGSLEVPTLPFGLRQLTTPIASAAAVKDFLIAAGSYAGKSNAGLNNPAAPLATVDYWNTPDPATALADPDSPTFDKLVSAIHAWFKRCGANGANVAFLYLCGHGLKVQNLAFLARDFGDPDAEVGNPWNRAISLDSIRRGMLTNAARAHFLFFDCCRTHATAYTDDAETGHRMYGGWRPKVPRAGFLESYATLEGDQAYGRSNEPSYFTRALLDGLMGYGAERRAPHGWVVTNIKLYASLHELMYFESGATANRQLASGEAPGLAHLHVLRETPQVKVRVRCDPERMLPNVAFEMSRGGVQIKHAGNAGEYRGEIAPGEWAMSMSHIANAWPPVSELPLVYTPVCEQVFPYPP